MIDLTDLVRFKPDFAELARRRLSSARQRLGWTEEQLAEALGQLVSWEVSAEAVKSWETQIVAPSDVLLATDLLVQRGVGHGEEPESHGTPGADLLEDLVSRRFADLVNVFPTRAAFSSELPPHVLLGSAKEVSAAGLSLNLVCQQYPSQQLRRLIDGGCRMRCLFLAPNGVAIRTREQEEGYPPGHLSELTNMNIHILGRLREQLEEEARERLVLATYDEPLRFNVIMVDSILCTVQFYLPALRGVDSPTFLLRPLPSGQGLFPAIQQAFDWLWERSSPVC